MILILLLNALFAASFPIARIAVKASDPIFFTAIRMILSGLLLIGYQFYRKRKIFPETKLGFFYLGLLTIFNIFFTNVLEFWSLKFLISGKASFIYSICPFLTALFSYFILSEKITLKKFYGMIIGAIGLIIILLQQTPIEKDVGGIGFLSWPEIAMIFAAVATVIGWITMKKFLQESNQSLISANATSMLFGGILSFITSMYFEQWNPLPINNTVTFLQTTVALTLLSNIICYNMYGYLLKKYSTTLLSFFGFVQPLFAAFYGWIFLGESVSWEFYVASFIVLIGLYVFYSEELEQQFSNA